MVEEIKSIIERYPKQLKTDVELLLSFARNSPNDVLAFMLLQNYTPDLFNSDLWNKADLISAQYKSLLIEKNQNNENVFETDKLIKNATLTEQWAIIDAFLEKKVPVFI
jgi:hypothetical protein